MTLIFRYFTLGTCRFASFARAMTLGKTTACRGLTLHQLQIWQIEVAPLDHVALGRVGAGVFEDPQAVLVHAQLLSRRNDDGRVLHRFHQVMVEARGGRAAAVFILAVSG